jgi:hypothetical protein
VECPVDLVDDLKLDPQYPVDYRKGFTAKVRI